MAKKFNYFTARVKLKPTDTTIKIKPTNTVQIRGVGNYLGGKFYVQDVNISIDTGGLSLELTVIKVKFPRSSVKPKAKSKGKKTGKKTQIKKHKVKKGETLLSITKKYFKNKNKTTQRKHLNKMKKKNNIKDEKEKLKVGRIIYIV